VPTPSPTHVIQGQERLDNRQEVKFDLETTAAGTLDITVGYVYDDSWINVFLTDRLCGYPQFQRDECDYLVKSGGPGPRPRTLRASGVKPGTYSLFVTNDGPHDEQLSYQVFLTATAGFSARVTVGPPQFLTRP
jgi:hypothetical protein